MYILIAHAQPAFRETLKLHLEEALGDDHLIEYAGNEAEALRKIKDRTYKPYQVLITSIDLPANRQTTTDQARRGLRLLEALPGMGHGKTKCVVIKPAELPHGTPLNLPNVPCSFVIEGAEMFATIISVTRAALAETKFQPRLSITFVEDPNSSNWNFWIDGGPGYPGNKQGSFALAPTLMRSLAEESKSIGDADDWLGKLAKVGEVLCEHIFYYSAFSTPFGEAMKNAGGLDKVLDKVRLSFEVSQTLYPLALEALVKPERNPPGWIGGGRPLGDLPFWMLKTPICRSFSLRQTAVEAIANEPRPPLFEDGGEPINCLIIEADAAGDVIIPSTGKTHSFPRLVNVDKECDWLQNQLETRLKEGCIGKLKRVSVSTVPQAMSFREYLKGTLIEGNWQLVHFAGHCYYQRGAIEGSPGDGYLILPGKPVEALDARAFAHWLHATQLLFLSGCRSSEEVFALEMVKNNIPAVVGFRWDTDDQSAGDFARSFYNNLFCYRSIESAFVAARKEVRDTKGAQEQIWAAPMLVLLERAANAAPAAAAAAA